MAIFLDQDLNLHALNAIGLTTMSGHLEIEFTEIGKDYLVAKMPINSKTCQPMGLLHGGASVVLAETIGSVASNAYIAGQDSGKYCVGLSINANHLRPVTEGYVFATCRPIHLGRTTHVWNIELHDEKGRQTCISRLTMAVVS